MTMFSAAAMGIGAVFLMLYLKPQQKEITVLIGVCVTGLLFSGTAQKAVSACRQILSYADGSDWQDTLKILLKALGIAALGQISADICREAGENTVGTHLEQFAKAEILLLSLPLTAELIALVREMLA